MPGSDAPPVVTWALAAGIVAMAALVTGFFPTEASIAPVAWDRGALAAQRWDKLLLSLFAHGGLLHLVVNLVALLGFGGAVERALGPARFAAIYFASGIAGALAHTALGPALPVVGASGAIFGLFGLLMILAPRQPIVLFYVLPTPILLAGALYVASVPVLVRLGDVLPVAHEAHLGGMAVGLAAAFALNPWRALRVLPAAAVVFVAAFLAVAYVVDTGPLRLLEGPLPHWLGLWWPVLSALVALAGGFGYLRMMDEEDAGGRTMAE